MCMPAYMSLLASVLPLALLRPSCLFACHLRPSCLLASHSVLIAFSYGAVLLVC